MPALATEVNPSSDPYRRARLRMEALLTEVEYLHSTVARGGSSTSVQRHRDRGKLPVRERLSLLADRHGFVLELSPLAGWGTTDPLGGGLVTAVTEIHGRAVVVIANDPTVRGGSLSPTSISRTLRAMDIAETNRLPVVTLVESGGADLDKQADIFVPGGEQFRRLTELSASGIPTVSIVFGSSTAGGAYLPGMSDYTIFVKDRGYAFLGGPPLVKMAIDEDVTEQELGGADMHARVSGLADHLAADEPDAIRQARSVISRFDLAEPVPGGPAPAHDPDELLGIVPEDPKTPFDIREVIARIVDASQFDEFKPLYGPNLVTGWAELNGMPIGVLANNGILFSPESQKGAQFIGLCNQLGTPILFIQMQHVADRVIRVLSGSRARLDAGPDDPRIFVAEDLSPADMLSLRSAVGFAIDQGGATSHTAILARGMNVPAVVGAGLASRLIADDDLVVLDGEQGLVIVAPDDGVLEQYRHLQAVSLREHAQLQKLLDVPAVTRDGTAVQLCANIERPDEAHSALAAGAEGVGLFRSEFLFLNRRDLPDEDEQYEAYREAVVAMQGRPVTIRTLDVGADKALARPGAPIAQNPALGRRAIRYCLSQPSMFLVQLRAILRASAQGPVRLLIPMLAHGHEIDQTLRLIGIAKVQLNERGIAFDEGMPVGGMVEIPAAALSASLFVRRLDFLSIGTNDLTQYTLAIDRTDHEVASLYEPFHPSVLRLVAMTIRAARRAGKPVAVCGEMAGDWGATQLLLGMGLREFSMHPASLLRVKREVLRADTAALAPRVARLLQAVDPLRMRAQLARLVAVP